VPRLRARCFDFSYWFRIRYSNDFVAASDGVATIADMDEIKIALGPVTLLQRLDGTVWVSHRALASAVQIDSAALTRWLLRFLREQVAA